MPRDPAVKGHRMALRNFEYAMRCLTCKVLVGRIRASEAQGMEATANLLLKQEMRKHEAKTGCEGRRFEGVLVPRGTI